MSPACNPPPTGGGLLLWVHQKSRAATSRSSGNSLYLLEKLESLMADTNETVTVSSTLPKSLFDALVELSKKRGVSANTVLQDAIAREKYFSEKEANGASILIEEKDKSLKKVTRG